MEGRSVVDMKTAERRATPRGRVQFRTTVSSAPMVEGTGLLLDLSSGGCRLESPVMVEPRMSLELQIYTPDRERPLLIEAPTCNV